MLSIQAAIRSNRSFLTSAIKAAQSPCWTAVQATSTAPQATNNRWHTQQRRLLAQKVDAEVDADGLKVVYRGSLAHRMRAVKVFSLTTSIAGVAAQPILIEQGMKLGGTALAVFLSSIGAIFTFVTPVLLHVITKKYVTELSYNPATEEYVATTISLFLLKIRTKFRPSDVTVPDVPGMFTSFLVGKGKKALFVEPTLFEDPEHYVRIMGYDKPLDFKLDLETNTTPTDPSKPTSSKTT